MARAALLTGMRWMRAKRAKTYLLHDSGLALGEGDVPTRLVLDELDLNLPALAAGLVVVVVIIVGSRAWTLGAAVLGGSKGAIAVVVERRRRVLVVVGDFGGHGRGCAGWWLRVFGGRGPKLLPAGVCGEVPVKLAVGRTRRMLQAVWENLG